MWVKLRSCESGNAVRLWVDGAVMRIRVGRRYEEVWKVDRKKGRNLKGQIKSLRASRPARGREILSVFQQVA
jgi:hypothetical protein